MRDQRLYIMIKRRSLIHQYLIGQRRGGGVLHPTKDEIRYNDLAVTGVRVGHTNSIREEIDHGRSAAKAP